MEVEVQANDAGTLHTYAQNGVLNFRGEPALKKKTGKWRGSFPMLVIQVAITIIFFGIISNLVTYMTLVLHKGVVQSATDINNWNGTLFCSSLLGAFISDAYWGRYKTMSFSFLLYFLGLSSLTISASSKSLRPPPCQPSVDQVCKQPTAPQSALFYLSLYAIALAGGSLTPSLVAFGADQFDEDDDVERQKKYSFFNYVPFCTHIGGLISVTVLVYIEDNVGWSWGFGILLFVVFVAMVFFFFGTPRYRYRAPEGSPLTMIAQVLVAALTKRNYVASADNQELHEDKLVSKGKRRILHTEQFRWLDKAALVSGEKDSQTTPDPWKICTVTRVEEVKLVIRMLPVWLATLWFTTAPSQIATFFVRQGMAMDNRLDRNFKVPPASMLIFSNLTVIAFLPVYDRILVPTMRRITGKERGISLLQRIGLGILVNNLGVVIAAVVEMMRKRAVDVSEVSIFWLVPQYAVLGAAEGLANPGLLEFFHEQSPDTFHSLGVSLALVNVGVGAFLSSVFISCVNRLFPLWLQNDVNKGHLDLFYWLLAGLSIINMVVYVAIARWYSYKKAEDYVETV